MVIPKEMPSKTLKTQYYRTLDGIKSSLISVKKRYQDSEILQNYFTNLFISVAYSSLFLSNSNLLVFSSNALDQGINIHQLHDFNFAAAGDWGCDKKAQVTVNNMVNKTPELVFALGDLSYQKSADCWFQIMSPMINKTKIVFGDHEYNFKNSSRLKEYLQGFDLDSQYYSLDHGNVHFLGMSSEVPFDKASKQYEFVKQDLQSASENKSVGWIVVYFYEMMYSSPTFHKVTENLRDAYHPLFDKYGVDLVLQVHSHNYQRSYPIVYNEIEPSQPIITEKDEEKYSDPKGSIFVVAGTAGADQHNFTGQAPYVVKQFQRFGFLMWT